MQEQEPRRPAPTATPVPDEPTADAPPTTVGSDGVVDEPADDAAPDFNADLDPDDAP